MNACDPVQMYLGGMTIAEISKITGASKSTTRRKLLLHKVLRSSREAMALAASKGRMSHFGVRRNFSPEALARMAAGKAEYLRANPPRGYSVKKDGYAEITVGPNKHRPLHVVLIEQQIGRRISPDECVHHIDHNRNNNDLSNLKLMTKSEHSRLHALETLPKRIRNQKGQFK